MYLIIVEILFSALADDTKYFWVFDFYGALRRKGGKGECINILKFILVAANTLQTRITLIPLNKSLKLGQIGLN